MSTDGQGTKWRRNISENFNGMSRVHERYRRQTDDRRQTDGRRHTLCSKKWRQNSNHHSYGISYQN